MRQAKRQADRVNNYVQQRYGIVYNECTKEITKILFKHYKYDEKNNEILVEPGIDKLTNPLIEMYQFILKEELKVALNKSKNLKQLNFTKVKESLEKEIDRFKQEINYHLTIMLLTSYYGANTSDIRRHLYPMDKIYSPEEKASNIVLKLA